MSEFTFVCKVPDPPCERDCTMRSEDCHGKCKAYKAWQEESRRIKSAAIAQRNTEGALDGFCREQARKNRERSRKSSSSYRGR